MPMGVWSEKKRIQGVVSHMIDRPLQGANEGSEIDQPILHKGVDPPVNALSLK